MDDTPTEDRQVAAADTGDELRSPGGGDCGGDLSGTVPVVELLTAPCICGHSEDKHRWFGGRWLSHCHATDDTLHHSVPRRIHCPCPRYEPDPAALENLRAAFREAAVPPLNPDIGRTVVDGGEVGTLVRCPECHGHGTLHQPH